MNGIIIQLTKGKTAVVDAKSPRGRLAVNINWYFFGGHAYRNTRIAGKKGKQTLEQFILGITPGSDNHIRIAHRNKDTLDCRLDNLRAIDPKNPFPRQKPFFELEEIKKPKTNEIGELKRAIVSTQTGIKRLVNVLIPLTRRSEINTAEVDGIVAILNDIRATANETITVLGDTPKLKLPIVKLPTVRVKRPMISRRNPTRVALFPYGKLIKLGRDLRKDGYDDSVIEGALVSKYMSKGLTLAMAKHRVKALLKRL